MTHEYEIHQSADDRKEAATQRIKEKIAVLELWESDGVPDGYEWSERNNPDKQHDCPTNVSQFAKWNDNSLKVKVRIDGKEHAVNGVFHFSVVALDKPERSALKKRAKELLDSIKKRPAPKKEVSRLKAELRAAEVFTKNLVNENARLRHEVATMEENMSYVQTISGNLKARIAELERELERANKTRGLHPVK